MDSVFLPFLPFDPRGSFPHQSLFGWALPGMFCGCRVDSATGIGVFPIVGVRNPVPSPGARGMTLGLSSSLLLRLATSGILSKASPPQYIHSPGHLIHHKDIPSVGLLPLIGLNIYPRISLFSASQVPSMHALLISSAVLSEAGKNPSLPGTLGPPQQSSEC